MELNFYKDIDTSFSLFEKECSLKQMEHPFDLLALEYPEHNEEKDDCAPIEIYERFICAFRRKNLYDVYDELDSLMDYTFYNEIIDQQELADSGLLDALYELATVKDNETLSMKAFSVLINISSLSKNLIDPLNTRDFFEFLVSFLQNDPNNSAIPLAVSCLRNFCAASVTNRDIVIQVYPVVRIEAMFRDYEIEGLGEELLNLLLAYSRYDMELSHIESAIKFIFSIIRGSNLDHIGIALWTLIYIMKNNGETEGRIYSEHFITRIFKFLDADEQNILIPSILIMSKFSEIPFVTNNAPYGEIIPNLNHESVSVSKTVLSFLRHAFIKNRDIESKLISNKLLLNISELLNGDYEIQAKILAGNFLVFLLNQGSQEFLDRVIITGAISMVIELFDLEDDELTFSTLCGIECLFIASDNSETSELFLSSFEENGGINALEQYVDCENERISEKAMCILNEFVEK